MTKINLICTGANLQALVHGEITSGMRGIEVEISFDEAWQGLTPVLVVSCAEESRRMAIDGAGRSTIPWECCISGEKLNVGVCGLNADGTVKLPTVWASCGRVRPSPDDAQAEEGREPPSPDLVEQITALANQAQEAAHAVTEAAQRGDFNGQDGVTPNIQIGTVTTVSSGMPAAVRRRGTDENPVFDFDIPKGADGSGGGGSGADIPAWVTPSKPNVSYFYNDAGYLTQHQDISGKQDKITDLSTIRSGAAAGSTALQPGNIADWAKQPQKPSYTAQEIGAYQKPTSGIPENDLSQSVQEKLNSGGGSDDGFTVEPEAIPAPLPGSVPLDKTLTQEGSAAEAKATGKAIAETQRSIDAMWKLSKGQLWDIESVECEGNAQLPSGGEYGNVDAVYGNTTQDGEPTPENPVEVKSVESIHILHTDADGNTLDERTIAPPRPLNAIGAYRDKLDAVNGVWEYIFISVKGSDLVWSLPIADKKTFRAGISNFPFQKTGYLPAVMATDYRRTATKSNNASIADSGDMAITCHSLYNGVFINDSRFEKSQQFAAAIADKTILYASDTSEYIPIDRTDLEWLRNLTVLPGEKLSITDNHGRDSSYIMADFINLGKVGD